jgi:low temperature requirement protein LtrA
MSEHHARLLRMRDGNHARVSFAELFFDLIFVFAVTQLSHSLLAHHSLLGFVETGMLFLAIWWSWIYTTWLTNWLDPDRVPVRLLLFALMASGLGMAIAIPQAFGDRGGLFAVAFASQLIRPLFMIFALRAERGPVFHTFVRIFFWSGGAAAMWLWGGFADPHDRLWIWGIALGIEFAGPALGYWIPGLGAAKSTDWQVEGAHIAERCGLFVIIALGESILITGATFAEKSWTPPVLLGFASAFLGTIAMWWIYFNIGAERGSDRIAHHDDPGKVARLAYTYLHLLLVAGIVLTAASDEMVLAHPSGHTDPLTTFCLVGGPALYLLGNMFFKRVTGANNLPLSHLFGLGLSAVLAIAAWPLHLEPVTLSMAATAILILVAVSETLSFHTPKPA